MSNVRDSASASIRQGEMGLLLHHVHGTLDLLNTVARSKDASSDMESLCISPLDNVVDGAMREIERVSDYVDSLPCSAADILFLAIIETERLVAAEAEADSAVAQRLREILTHMTAAHKAFEEGKA